MTRLYNVPVRNNPAHIYHSPSLFSAAGRPSLRSGPRRTEEEKTYEHNGRDAGDGLLQTGTGYYRLGTCVISYYGWGVGGSGTHHRVGVKVIHILLESLKKETKTGQCRISGDGGGEGHT